MAKAKKSDSGSSKKPSTKASARPSDMPLVDTNLAAESAAKMLLNKPTMASPAQPKKESAAFKNLKESFNKPHLAGLNNVMGGSTQQKSNLPHRHSQQKGHNQTFGADVNRTGVPRRTPG